MRISYFVFTSGEDGTNMMDWGVKHSSASLGNRKALDNEYQSLLAEFGMPPSLEVPNGNRVNILLLPYNNGSALLGYVFPLTDHKGRPNTSSILCVIPHHCRRTESAKLPGASGTATIFVKSRNMALLGLTAFKSATLQLSAAHTLLS